MSSKNIALTAVDQTASATVIGTSLVVLMPVPHVTAKFSDAPLIATRRLITLAPMKTGTTTVIGPIPPVTVSVCIVVEPPRTDVGPVISVTSSDSIACAVKSPECSAN